MITASPPRTRSDLRSPSPSGWASAENMCSRPMRTMPTSCSRKPICRKISSPATSGSRIPNPASPSRRRCPRGSARRAVVIRCSGECRGGQGWLERGVEISAAATCSWCPATAPSAFRLPLDLAVSFADPLSTPFLPTRWSRAARCPIPTRWRRAMSATRPPATSSAGGRGILPDYLARAPEPADQAVRTAVSVEARTGGACSCRR